jgi:hypothetical protein
MRTSAHAAQVFAQVVGDNAVLKFPFRFAFRAGGLGRVSRKLGRPGSFRCVGLRDDELREGKNYAARNE